MSYKISVSLDVATREDRDEVLRGLRSMLLSLGLGVQGKITVKHEREFKGGDYLSLFGFGIEEREPTPIEQAIDQAVADAEELPEPIAPVPLDDDVAPPPAQACEDDEPRTPFDRLLGREEESDGSN